MFKLKLINKPKIMKLKCNFSFPPIILANLQEKEVTPTKETQILEPDKDFTGLSKVTVHPIPNEYIVPSGEVEFTQNGTYDVTDKASAKVNIKEKVLGTKTITSNGTYKAIDDNLDGYSEVEVATSGVDINEYMSDTITFGLSNAGGWTQTIKKLKSPLIVQGNNASYMFGHYPTNEIPQIDTSNVTTMDNMFSNSNIINAPQLDTSNVTDMQYMFYYCQKLITIPQLDTSNVTSMAYMFYRCVKLLEIPQLDTSKVTDIRYAMNSCSNLTTIPLLNFSSMLNINQLLANSNNITNLGGFQNLGQAYLTTQNENYFNYKLDLAYKVLTEQSIINVLTNLYDIATKGVKPQTVTLESTNLAKLTSEEGQAALAQAQQFGWNIN